MSATSHRLEALLAVAAHALASSTDELNRLDGFAGDGDLGNYRGAADMILAKLARSGTGETK